MHIDWVFLTLSTFVTFAVLLLCVRLIGATQLTQLTFFNWVAGASMGNVAANMLTTTNRDAWITSCYTLVMFSVATVIFAYIALKSRGFRRVANGEPTVLIHKGIVLRENLKRTQVNLDVLMMMLREKGYFEYRAIEFAILEPTGNLSILPTQASQSVSKEDLVKGPDLSNDGQGPYIELVIDGEIDEDKLRSTNHTREWIEQKIHELGGKGIRDATFFAVNKEGEVIADLHRTDEKTKRDDPDV